MFAELSFHCELFNNSVINRVEFPSPVVVGVSASFVISSVKNRNLIAEGKGNGVCCYSIYIFLVPHRASG